MKLDDFPTSGTYQHKYHKRIYTLECVARTVHNILDRRLIIREIDDNRNYWIVPEADFFETYERIQD